MPPLLNKIKKHLIINTESLQGSNFLIGCFCLKKIIRLAGITENYDNNCCNNFGDGGIPAQVIDKKFKKQIVKKDADNNHQDIAG